MGGWNCGPTEEVSRRKGGARADRTPRRGGLERCSVRDYSPTEHLVVDEGERRGGASAHSSSTTNLEGDCTAPHSLRRAMVGTAVLGYRRHSSSLTNLGLCALRQPSSDDHRSSHTPQIVVDECVHDLSSLSSRPRPPRDALSGNSPWQFVSLSSIATHPAVRPHHVSSRFTTPCRQ